MNKLWLALQNDGRIVSLGHHESFDDANESASKLPNNPVWILDSDTARLWVDMINTELKQAQTPLEKRIESENVVIRSFVNNILNDSRQFTISVFDGEEWVVRWSRDKEAILNAMYQTDQDMIRVRLNEDIIGSVTFTYGNAGYEVASDWTDTPLFNELIAKSLKVMKNQKY